MEDKPIFYIVARGKFGPWYVYAIFDETEKTFAAKQFSGGEYYFRQTRIRKPETYVRAETIDEAIARQDDLMAIWEKFRSEVNAVNESYRKEYKHMIDALNAATGVKS